MVASRDLFWLAGLIEGEGTFYYNKTDPTLKIAMTDRDIIDRAAYIMGRPVRLSTRRARINLPNGRGGPPSEYKQVYVTRVGGVRAVGWMLTLYSLLGERRRAKIRQVLEQWRARRSRPARRHICPRGHVYSNHDERGWRKCRDCINLNQNRRRVAKRVRGQSVRYP